MKKLLVAFLPLAVLVSCGNKEQRKLLIVAGGAITVSGNNISVGDTTNGAGNQEIDLKDASQSSFNLNNNGQKSTVNIPTEPGFYVYNASASPLFGGELKAGRDYNVNHGLDLDEQKAYIDSVQKVLAGTNVSAANKTYIITSGQLLKLADDAAHTHVFAPFVPVSDVSQAADGKPTDLYKFYSKDELENRLKEVQDSYSGGDAAHVKK